jgi:predicted amidophosphoribosyltransferase
MTTQREIDKAVAQFQTELDKLSAYPCCPVCGQSFALIPRTRSHEWCQECEDGLAIEQEQRDKQRGDW